MAGLRSMPSSQLLNDRLAAAEQALLEIENLACDLRVLLDKLRAEVLPELLARALRVLPELLARDLRVLLDKLCTEVLPELELQKDNTRKAGNSDAVWCPDCEMWLNGPTQYEDHKIGRKHLKNGTLKACDGPSCGEQEAVAASLVCLTALAEEASAADEDTAPSCDDEPPAKRRREK